jgi:superfamily II DNA or RNA helicase
MDTLKIVSNKRNLILRPYQEPASDFAFYNDISVLAVAPNGGKTEISIDVIRRCLLLNTKWRVLVLTHSTNVLKDNYTERLDGLNLNFKYSTEFADDCQVHICLPHSEHLINLHYDFVIVDEAHENYLAPRMQKIIKKTTPSKQLLLTGSPFPFIKKGGYKIYTLAVNSLPEEYFAKLQIELVTSKYNWDKKYNNKLELTKGIHFSTSETRDAMEKILLKLIERVKKGLSAEEFNTPGLLAKFKSWIYTYKKLGKTMIVCKSINQAKDVNNILNEHGVGSVVSDSETDKDSLQISNFKNNKVNVLVVVDRARLGYSDENLYNIIDMSGTHNPNVIYQIFCRALRGNQKMQKYYLKVTTQEFGMKDITTWAVSAALMLTDKKFLSTYSGNNLTGIKIPIIKQIHKNNKNYREKRKRNSNISFPDFTLTTDVIDLFKNIIHDLNEPVSIYKLVTLHEVKAQLTNKIIWTEELIWSSAKGEI